MQNAIVGNKKKRAGRVQHTNTVPFSYLVLRGVGGLGLF